MKQLSSRRLLKSIKSKRSLALISSIALIVFFASLPLAAGTNSYPLAIVNGNSMYPTLHNGDLVFFMAVHGQVREGTIIVFVQGGSGIGILDNLLRPIVIHRVVGSGHEPNGMIYYQTKGDNNLAPDPFVTDSTNVLGVPVLVIPYAGFPFQFLTTPFGMVVISCFMTLFFLSGIDSKIEQEKEKKRLVALFARHSLNGEITPSQFERLKLAVEFYEDISPDLISDPTIISTIDWLRGGGLFTRWREERIECTDCKTPSFRIISGEKSFLFCPNCCLLQRK